MSANTNASPDWVGGTRTKLLAWGLPHAALVAGLLVMVPARTAIWIAALAWMGVACILNARRCGRTLRPAFPDGWSSVPSLSSAAKRFGGQRSARGGGFRSAGISFSGSDASLVIISFNELAAARRGLFPLGKGRRKSGSGRGHEPGADQRRDAQGQTSAALAPGDGPAQIGGGLARSATSRHFAALPAARLKQ